MSIIVPSNHTRIGAWVTSKMSVRNPPVYCTFPLIACRDINKNRRHDKLDCNSMCYITSRIRWVYKQQYNLALCFCSQEFMTRRDR